MCLNPDVCTVKGRQIVPETGLLGKYYELIGGEVIYYGKPHNIKPDGSWIALDAGDGTFLYTSDSNKAHWPDIKLEAQVGGDWQMLGTASWKSGSLSLPYLAISAAPDSFMNA